MYIKKEDLNGCWESTISLFLDNYKTGIEQGREIAYVEDVLLDINKPNTDQEKAIDLLWNKKFINEYIFAFEKDTVNPELDKLIHFGENDLNQYERLVKDLKEGYENELYYISVFDPLLEIKSRNVIPCLMLLQFERIKNRLFVKAFYSRMNLYTLGLLDMYQIAYIQRKAAFETGLEIGGLKVYVSKLIMNMTDIAVYKESMKRLDKKANV